MIEQVAIARLALADLPLQVLERFEARIEPVGEGGEPLVAAFWRRAATSSTAMATASGERQQRERQGGPERDERKDDERGGEQRERGAKPDRSGTAREKIAEGAARRGAGAGDQPRALPALASARKLVYPLHLTPLILCRSLPAVSLGRHEADNA